MQVSDDCSGILYIIFRRLFVLGDPTMEDDEAVRESVLSEVDKFRDIILVGHYFVQ